MERVCASGRGVSQRWACRCVGSQRSSQRYRSRRPKEEELRRRLRELAEERIRWGYRRLHVLLKREGWAVNHKRLHRLYRSEGLQVRRRKRKRLAVARCPMEAPSRINERWSMDYVGDVLATGRRYRILNVVDDKSREDLASEAGTSLPAARVIQALEEIGLERGFPERIVVDNGPEFRSRALDEWAYARKVTLEFIEPGKPMQNPYAESFNGRMRDECLNSNWFYSVAEARAGIAEYRADYNNVRPHSALGQRTPAEYARAESRGTYGSDRLEDVQPEASYEVGLLAHPIERTTLIQEGEEVTPAGPKLG